MPKSTRTSARSHTLKKVFSTAPTKRRTRSGSQTIRQSLLPLPASKEVRTRRKPKVPLAAFLARPHDAINEDPNRRTRLLALPIELLQEIAGHLPLVSTICLTLTCKEAAEAIGNESWARWKKEKQWLISGSVELLAKDWSDILDHCPRCNTLHPPLQPPRSHRETKLTKICFGQDAMIDYLPQDASHGYCPVFSHIADAMEESQHFSSKGDMGPLINSLSGSFTITRGDVLWNLDSSSQRIDGNLIIKHVHTLRSQSSRIREVTNLVALPIRLCPHQSTTTATPQRSRYIRGKCAEQNGRLLTQVIAMEMNARKDMTDRIKNLRPLTPSEQAQLSAKQAGKKVHWRCRSCPTKFYVQRQPDAFVITSWHCFGRDLYHASKYWKWLVRRTGTTLGPDKRNDEWWSPSRTVPDFFCESSYTSVLT